MENNLDLEPWARLREEQSISWGLLVVLDLKAGVELRCLNGVTGHHRPLRGPIYGLKFHSGDTNQSRPVTPWKSAVRLDLRSSTGP
jgi:hypothetical protein